MHAVMLGILNFRLPTLNNISLLDLSNFTGKIFSNMLNELLDVSVSFYKLYWLILLTKLPRSTNSVNEWAHCSKTVTYFTFSLYISVSIPDIFLLL
jgi:hypothetical protein